MPSAKPAPTKGKATATKGKVKAATKVKSPKASKPVIKKPAMKPKAGE